MTKSESRVPPQAQEFFEFWLSAFQQFKGHKDQNTDWRQELEEFWEKQDLADPEQAEAFYENLVAATGFYKQFSQAHEKEGGDRGLPDGEHDAQLFYSIPLRLFEQHMKTVGIDPDSWDVWLQGLRDEPETLERYRQQSEALGDSIRHYMNGFSSMVERASDRFKKQEKASDVKQAFSSWIDCFEQEYASYIRDPEYPEQFSAVLNGSLTLQKTLMEVVEPWSGIGTAVESGESKALRKQNADLQKEVLKLRRENEALKKKMGK